METKVLDRNSTDAREQAKYPVGKTFVNEDAMEEARQMAARWARVASWGGEGRGVWGLLELPNWRVYDDGTDDLSETRLAIVVTDARILDREPWVEVSKDRRHYIGRYQYSGLIYYLRNDDDPGLDLPMPAGAVPFEKVTSLPGLVRVSGLHPIDEAI